MIAKVDPWRIEDDGTEILDMSVGERFIWLISAFWASWRLLNIQDGVSNETAIHLSRTLAGFTCIAFLATLFSFRSKPKTASDFSSSCSSDDADADVNIEKITDSPARKRRLNDFKTVNGRGSETSEKVTKIRDIRIGRSRLFGKSRASFRSGADDGALCGILLTPLVASSKLVSTASNHTDDKNVQTDLMYYQTIFELVLLFGIISTLHIHASYFMRPFRRLSLKYGVLVSTLIISCGLTVVLVRFMPFTMLLQTLPLGYVLMHVIIFQLNLYLCATALRRSFTFGEMCLIAQAGTLLAMSATTILMGKFMPNNLPRFLTGNGKLSPIKLLGHAVILGILFIGLITYPVLWHSRGLAQRRYWKTLSTGNTRHPSLRHRKILTALAIYVITALTIILLISPLCTTLLGENAFLWTVKYVFMSPPRITLCLFWAISIAVTVVIWVLVLDVHDTPQSTHVGSQPATVKQLTSSLNKKRKLFHALAVVMFVPGLLYEPAFLQLAFSVALAAFIYLEYLRFFAVWPYGKNIHIFLTEFIDSRDLGPVILSHVYLLLGCAESVWLEGSSVLASLSGILTLGFGDAMASIIGKRFGRIRWFRSHKTIEGTLAFVLSVLFGSGLILYTMSPLSLSFDINTWIWYTIVVSMTGLMEAFSTQNDNLVVPLFMFALIELAY
ncbi:dolichol kinase [Umbelopsis nana]